MPCNKVYCHRLAWRLHAEIYLDSAMSALLWQQTYPPQGESHFAQVLVPLLVAFNEGAGLQYQQTTGWRTAFSCHSIQGRCSLSHCCALSGDLVGCCSSAAVRATPTSSPVCAIAATWCTTRALHHEAHLQIADGSCKHCEQVPEAAGREQLAQQTLMCQCHSNH